MTDYISMKSKMQEILQDKQQYKLRCEEQRERSEMLATENSQLKERLGELEEEAKAHKKTLKAMQVQGAQAKDLQALVDKARVDTEWLQ